MHAGRGMNDGWSTRQKTSNKLGSSRIALYQASQKPEIQAHMRGLALPLMAGVVFYVMEMLTGGSHALSFSVLFMGVVATVLYAVSWGLGKTSLDGAVRAGALTLLAALVPFLMASEGWDDHSRARRDDLSGAFRHDREV